MKKLVFVLNFVCLFALGVRAQSMYGDAVKADVKMKYVSSFEEALKKAREEKKLIFFNCFADWAVPCHAMNQLVFSDQAFADWMEQHFVNFFIDVTTPEGRPLADKYNIQAQAHYLVLDSNGEIVHRIVGGYEIPEFKARLEQALNPKTSLTGMNQRYANGERSVKFLRDYANVLDGAKEKDTYKQVVEELFGKLEKKDWAKKDYWKFFCYKIDGTNNEMFKYLVEHKADFVKSNGADAVNQFISGLYFGKLYTYAAGKEAYNGKELLDIYLDIQKAGIPEDNIVYSLYSLAKFRGEKNFDKMMDMLENVVPSWNMEVAVGLDLSLADLKDLDPTEEKRVLEHLKKRAESKEVGGAKKYYLATINAMTNTNGIRFEKTSFAEALQKAKTEGKLLFMDCYTTWCGPCKMMSDKVFTRKDIGEYFNTNFVNLKMDMEKKEGRELQKKYGVEAFPTMFLLDGDGNVVYRIRGAHDAKTFMAMIKRGVQVEIPFHLQKSRYEAGDRSVELMSEYFQTMADAVEVKDAEGEARSYLGTLKAPELYSKSAWKLYENFVTRTTDLEFKHLMTHREKFAESLGENTVNKKIERVIVPTVIEYLQGNVSKEDMAVIWELVKAAKFSPDYSLVLLNRIVSMYDQKAYDKMLDFYGKTVAALPDANVRLNLDALLNWLLKDASSDQKAKAKAYIENEMKNTKPELKNSYKALLDTLSK